MRKNSAFTLIELMIVVAIIAIIAAIALPGLLGARKGTNEQAAIATLRSIAAWQSTFNTKRYVDQDIDGAGEYGFLSELSGVAPADRDAGSQPAIGEIGIQALGTLNAAGRASKSGYLYHMFLPSDDTAGTNAIAETAAVVAAGVVAANADAQETRWCCYAWPVNLGNTGDRAFVINQQGQVYETDCSVVLYNANTVAPVANAAFVAGVTNINGALAGGAVGQDGNTWVQSGG